MGRFKDTNMLFANEDVLRDDYTPDELLERESEMKEYETALTPIVNDSLPRNIFVYGETGVGKTIATRMILDELTEDLEDFEGVSLRVVWLNCKDLTSYQAACKIVNEFRTSGNEISVSGHPRSEVHRMLWDDVNDVDESHVLFVLDEVDSFETDDELLYQIPRANSNNKVTETKVGLIGISNNFKFREGLSARVKSSLCEEEIHFTPYDANQLRSILEQRVDKAFLDGAIDDEVVPYTAAIVGQNTGSARQALDILYKAGSIAQTNDDEKVTKEHVERAEDRVERGVIKDELRALPTQTHAILYAISILDQRGECPVRKRRIYDVYQTVVERLHLDAKTSRTVHNRLSQLSLKGFLNVQQVNRGLNEGMYYQYELDVERDVITNVLANDSRVKEAMDDSQLSDFA